MMLPFRSRWVGTGRAGQTGLTPDPVRCHLGAGTGHFLLCQDIHTTRKEWDPMCFTIRVNEDTIRIALFAAQAVIHVRNGTRVAQLL